MFQRGAAGCIWINITIREHSKLQMQCYFKMQSGRGLVPENRMDLECCC